MTTDPVWPNLIGKAEELGCILGHVDQQISCQWLDIFKMTRRILFKVISGGVTSANNFETSEWEK